MRRINPDWDSRGIWRDLFFELTPKKNRRYPIIGVKINKINMVLDSIVNTIYLPIIGSTHQWIIDIL